LENQGGGIVLVTATNTWLSAAAISYRLVGDERTKSAAMRTSLTAFKVVAGAWIGDTDTSAFLKIQHNIWCSSVRQI